MWDDTKQLNTISAALVVFAVAACVWGAVSWAVRQPVLAFREVAVRTPLTRVDASHLEAAIRHDLRGTFFTMDLDRSRTSLAKVPWVRKVALRRQWPARLEITIEEHLPLARWNDAALMNTDGELFTAEYGGDLPRFNGPDGRAVEVATRYREWSRSLTPLGLALHEVTLSPRGGWHLRAVGQGAPLAIELGRDDASARLARFIAAHGRTLAALARSGTRVEQVDLRYRNGFAARIPGFKERSQKKPV